LIEVDALKLKEAKKDIEVCQHKVFAQDVELNNLKYDASNLYQSLESLQE